MDAGSFTLAPLWQEYRQEPPASATCTAWRSQVDVVMRKKHRAGEKLFVDWTGMPPRHHRPHGRASWRRIPASSRRLAPRALSPLVAHWATIRAAHIARFARGIDAGYMRHSGASQPRGSSNGYGSTALPEPNAVCWIGWGPVGALRPGELAQRISQVHGDLGLGLLFPRPHSLRDRR